MVNLRERIFGIALCIVGLVLWLFNSTITENIAYLIYRTNTGISGDPYFFLQSSTLTGTIIGLFIGAGVLAIWCKVTFETFTRFGNKASPPTNTQGEEK